MTWLPQYQQYSQWFDMNLQSCTIQLMPGGKIKATGKDLVGNFTFDGGFDKKNSNFKFLKQYVGQHQIFYHGAFNKSKYQFQGYWGFSPGQKDGKFRMRKV